MAMYFTVLYQAVCYDADGVLGEGGVGSGISVLVRCMYGLLRFDHQLPGRCRSQVGRILSTTGPD